MTTHNAIKHDQSTVVNDEQRSMAEALFQQAYHDFESARDVSVNLAQRKAHRGQAQSLVKKALHTYPSHVEALNLLARIHLSNNDVDKAKSILIKALEIDGQSVSNLFTLGNIFIQEQQYQSAIDLLKQDIFSML